jgi:hypothetical protein
LTLPTLQVSLSPIPLEFLHRHLKGCLLHCLSCIIYTPQDLWSFCPTPLSTGGYASGPPSHWGPWHWDNMLSWAQYCCLDS